MREREGERGRERERERERERGGRRERGREGERENEHLKTCNKNYFVFRGRQFFCALSRSSLTSSRVM